VSLLRARPGLAALGEPRALSGVFTGLYSDAARTLRRAAPRRDL
jgi:hypothetical protein